MSKFDIPKKQEKQYRQNPYKTDEESINSIREFKIKKDMGKNIQELELI